MKPSEMLKNTGRVIAYRPNLARLFGGVIAEVFFEQIFYWQDKTDSDLGVYKTQEELEVETGLSRKEQETARKLLREKGVLIETYKRLEHRLYYKIDRDKLDELLATLANVQNEHSPMPESDIRECDKVTFVNTLDYNTRLHTNNPLPLNGESANAEHSEVGGADKPHTGKKQNSIKVNYSAVAETYNTLVKELNSNLPLIANPSQLSDKRKKAIKKLAQVFIKRFEIDTDVESALGEYFKDFLKSATNFYFGENNRGWKADFEYILRETTLDKVLEGNW